MNNYIQLSIFVGLDFIASGTAHLEKQTAPSPPPPPPPPVATALQTIPNINYYVLLMTRRLVRHSNKQS